MTENESLRRNFWASIYNAEYKQLLSDDVVDPVTAAAKEADDALRLYDTRFDDPDSEENMIFNA